MVPLLTYLHGPIAPWSHCYLSGPIRSHYYNISTTCFNLLPLVPFIYVLYLLYLLFGLITTKLLVSLLYPQPA